MTYFPFLPYKCCGRLLPRCFSNLTMTSIGNIEPFDIRAESWSSYVDRLEQFLLCNKVEETLKKSTLLTVIGSSTNTLLQGLCAPAKPASKTYDQLVALLQTHLHPKPSIIAERYKFYRAIQEDHETIHDFVARIKKLTAYCEFGSSLTDSLRDRFVCGVRNDKIRERLLEKANPTFEEAIQLAAALEAAHKNAIALGRDRGSLQHISQQPTSRHRDIQRNSPEGSSRYKCYS